jgi:predicted enzyme related to lactoylglutathione lyase
MIKMSLAIDVPNVSDGVEFYVRAFGLTVSKRSSSSAVLAGAAMPIYLLDEPAVLSGREIRNYDRHWTPVHLDFLVGNLEEAVERAVLAGAKLDREILVQDWGRMANMADPFGNGFDLIEERKP